jgi:hypothetical protein
MLVFNYMQGIAISLPNFWLERAKSYLIILHSLKYMISLPLTEAEMIVGLFSELDESHPQSQTLIL